MMVMFEPSWNLQVDVQALARIDRSGQRRACHVYQLFVANSWEEAIFLSQTKKKQLFEPMSLEQVASFFSTRTGANVSNMGIFWRQSKRARPSVGGAPSLYRRDGRRRFHRVLGCG